ncbi:MAG: LD-carboxypeptidase [Candidatus Limnocylindrales bacterium]
MSDARSASVRKPARLRPGDTVALVAPATPWENRSELLRAVAGVEKWGLTVKLGEHVNDRHAYLAGRDEDRAADLNAAFADPEVRAILCLQGGYGSSRLIRLLDRDVIAANPKALCGYSDITSLHLAVAAWSDTITFYSNGASGVGAA